MRNPFFLSWISFEQKNAKCVFDLWRETHPNAFIDVIKLDSMSDLQGSFTPSTEFFLRVKCPCLLFTIYYIIFSVYTNMDWFC